MSQTRGSGQGFSGGVGRKYNKTDSKLVTYEFDIEATANGSQINTGIRIDSIAQVVSAFVKVDTAEVTGTTKTLNVGVYGGTAAAFLSAVNCSTTGPKGTPVTLVQDTSTNNTIGYTFASGNWAEFKGVVSLTMIQAD